MIQKVRWSEEKELLKWRRRNRYYYLWLERIYRFVVRPGARVLDVGCECGDLLAAVKPPYGVGIDTQENHIEAAKRRFPDLRFYATEPNEHGLEETFDYILVCNSIGKWRDIQQVLGSLRPLCDEDTRVVITYYSYLWEWILRFGSLVGLRRPISYQNWLPPADIENLLYLADFEVIRSDKFLILPKRVPPFTVVCNYILSILPGFRHLNLVKFFNVIREGKGEFVNGCRLVYPMEKEAMRFLNLVGNKLFGLFFTWLLGQRFRDTLCGTKMLRRRDYELIAANRSYFGDFDPFGDFDLIFGAVKHNLKIIEVPVPYSARTYGRTNINRFRNGIMLAKMSWVAFRKIKWLGKI